MKRSPVVILAGIRWGFLWQRHQALATLFARAGYPTVFVETTGIANPRPSWDALRKISARLRASGSSKAQVEKNLTIYAPVVAPPTAEAFRKVNTRIFAPRVVRDLHRLVGRNPIIIAYPPTRTTLDIVAGLEPRVLLYDRSDDYSAFPRIPDDIAATERELIQNSDLISCTSTTLLEDLRPSRPDAFLSGPAVEYERFAVLQNEHRDAIQTVCFFGDLSESRLDTRVFEAIAQAGIQVRLLGRLGRREKCLAGMPSINYVGVVDHSRLPEALAGVDAFVLPYKASHLTRGISPAKLYECLATGKPIVASRLPAIMELGQHIYQVDSLEDFVRALRNLQTSESEARVRARIELARANSWEARFGEIERRIQEALDPA